MAAKPIPEGFHTITPTLTIDGAAKAIDFYKRAFGAEERMSAPAPGGKIAHAELKIGDSIIMLNDVFPGMPEQHTVGNSTGLWLYVDDVDKTFKQAVEAGAESRQEPEDMFWGDRWARVRDPFGNNWAIATHIEDLSPEEMQKRSEQAMQEMMAGAPSS